jgi:hypothetical protein
MLNNKAMSICPRCGHPGRVISKVKSAGEFWACNHCRRVTDSGDHNLTWSTVAQWEYLHDTAATTVAADKREAVPAPPWVITAQDQLLNRAIAVPAAATTLAASPAVGPPRRSAGTRPKELTPAVKHAVLCSKLGDVLNGLNRPARCDALAPFGFDDAIHPSYALFVDNLDIERLNELAAELGVA